MAVRVFVPRRVLVAAVALSIAAACSRGEEPPKRTPPPDARRVDPSRAADLSGRVVVDGPLPPNERIKMAGDPVCAREAPDGATFETFVSSEGGLGNVFVYVKDGLGSYYFDAPSQPATLDQQGCQYRPHVFGVQVGQNIEFINSDPTAHTVHALPQANQEFNFTQVIQRQRDTKFFTKPEVMVRFKCDMHGWMSAYAGVLDHPYFGVTEPDGRFALKGLPAGTYTLEAWHEKLGTQTQQVTLAERGKEEIQFTFRTAAAAASP